MSIANVQWHLPPEILALRADEIHIWRAWLNLPASHLKSLWQTLSTDEHQRAERFFFQKDRDKFIATRGLLRTILSRYLSMKPEELCFCYGSYGKPALRSDFNQDKLCFNLSHSGSLALYAVAMNQELGIDLEQVRTNLDYGAIAQRYFSPQEITALLALPPGCRCEAFFRAWTCKEAYIKARGGAVFQALNQVEVSFAPGTVALLKIDGDSRAAANESLLTLNPEPGYVAALAMTRRRWQIKCWRWEE
jgi:4'-phosphopantetheinyl transferase